MPDTLLDAHYGATSLLSAVRHALGASGVDGESLVAWDAYTALDQFHVGGAAATADLADRLGAGPGARLLDIGSGLGGPARQLAAVHGCVVTGIDRNAAYVELAAHLSERSGLTARTRFLVADAIDVPLAGGGFDLALSQHVAMNIADRQGLYREIHRLLAPGGRYALYDVIEGNGAPIEFPLPWARDPEASCVITAEATRHALESAGFAVVAWRDATADGMVWQQAQFIAQASGQEASTRLGLPLIMGPQFPAMVANLGRHLRDGRLRLLQALVQRRG